MVCLLALLHDILSSKYIYIYTSRLEFTFVNAALEHLPLLFGQRLNFDAVCRRLAVYVDGRGADVLAIHTWRFAGSR